MMSGFPFYRMNGLFGSWSLLVMLMCIAIVVLIIIGVVTLFGRSNKNKHNERSNSSLEILKERFARGEISKDEYEKIRKNIL